MKWSEVVKPKGAGGLGLGDLRLKNVALLAKWWWRFGEEKEVLWRRVIVYKYGESEWGWVPSKVLGDHVLGICGVIFCFGGELSMGVECFVMGSVSMSGRGVVSIYGWTCGCACYLCVSYTLDYFGLCQIRSLR